MKPKKPKSYWIVFYAESGSREDGSVFYSWLVHAESKEQAIARVEREEGEGNFDALEMNVLEG